MEYPRELTYSYELMITLNTFRTKECFCDTTLVVEGEEFHAHKGILAASCSFFKSVFSKVDRRKKVFYFQELQASVMEDLLSYLYTGKVEISESNVKELTSGANYLALVKLSEAGTRFLEERLCLSNCLSSFSFAKKHDLSTLREASQDMVLKNFSAVTKTDEFLALSSTHLGYWLSSDSLESIKSEREVYEALLRWYKFDEKRRQIGFGELLKHIRLECLPLIVLQEEAMKNNLEIAEKCTELVVKATKRLGMAADGHLPLKKPRKCLQTHADGIVISGGYKESSISESSTCCYVPQEEKWYELCPMTAARTAHAMATCQSFIFALGTSVGPEVASMERYDPRINSWSPVASLPQRIHMAGMASLDGFLYVVGGKGNDCKCVNASVQRYDPATNMWQLVAPLNVPRFAICTVTSGGFLYAIGGVEGMVWTTVVERYDPTSDLWVEITPMNEEKFCPVGTFAHDKIFVVGSSRHNSSEITCSSNCEMYDESVNQWQCIANTDVLSFTRIAWADGKVFLFGGYDVSNEIQRRKVKTYSLACDKWMANSPLPFDITMFGCCTVQIPRNALVKEISLS